MKLILFIHAYDIILYIYNVFCFGQVRTLVAMAPFSLLWLYLANSQVSVYRTIGPLVYFFAGVEVLGEREPTSETI